MATNTYAALTAEQRTFYVKTLLNRLTPALKLMPFAQTDTVPSRKGATVNWRRFNSYPAATTPLAEGTPPEGRSISVSAVTANLAQYGDFTAVSDLLDMAGIDPVITEVTQLHGEQAALTLDTIVRDVIAAGTNVIYASTATTRATVGAAMILTSAEIRKAVRLLKRNNARPQDGENYIALVHPNVGYDLRGDLGWTNANQYAGSTRIFSGELGKMYGVRFLESTQAPVWTGAGAAGIDVYGTVIFGAGAFGAPTLAGAAEPEVIVQPRGSGGTSDPLAQIATVGWKIAFASKRLTEEALVRIESAASA